jgi:hypothetical protein
MQETTRNTRAMWRSDQGWRANSRRWWGGKAMADGNRCYGVILRRLRRKRQWQRRNIKRRSISSSIQPSKGAWLITRGFLGGALLVDFAIGIHPRLNHARTSAQRNHRLACNHRRHPPRRHDHPHRQREYHQGKEPISVRATQIAHGVRIGTLSGAANWERRRKIS